MSSLAGHSCTVDNFAATIGHMLTKVDNEVVSGTDKVVRKGAQKARKYTVDKANDQKWHKGVTNNRYVSGWSYKVRGRGRMVEAEIGNRNTPGLPHLLEFGHAKVGGGRTTVYRHVEPAAEQAFDYTYDEIEKMVGRALR